MIIRPHTAGELARAIVRRPDIAVWHTTPALERAAARLRTLYTGQHDEPQHFAAMRAAERAISDVLRIRREHDAADAAIRAERAAAKGVPPDAPTPGQDRHAAVVRQLRRLITGQDDDHQDDDGGRPVIAPRTPPPSFPPPSHAVPPPQPAQTPGQRIAF